MQNFINHRISQRASKEFRRTVTGNTRIITLDNGNEVRNAMWRYKPMKFTANYALLSKEAQEEVVSAFWAANAMLYLFRFRDYGDCVVRDCQLDVEVGTTKPVQLIKRYQFGPTSAERIIQAVDTCKLVNPVSGTEIAGILDNELGFFTPSAAWESATALWSGTFSNWVRFGSDELDITMVNLHIMTTDIELVEKRATR